VRDGAYTYTYAYDYDWHSEWERAASEFFRRNQWADADAAWAKASLNAFYERVAASPSPLPSPERSDPPRLLEKLPTPIRHARLSTVRLPTPVPSSLQQRSTNYTELRRDGFYAPQAERGAGRAGEAGAFLRCANITAWWNDVATLPCVSAVHRDACLSAMRRCGTPQQNARNPFLELDLDGAPRTRRNRLFGLRFHVPFTPELRALFFGWSADPSRPGFENGSYTVQLFRDDGSAVPCPPPEERPSVFKVMSDAVYHICAEDGVADGPDGPDEQLHEQLGDVTRIRVTLPGDMRQIWLRGVEVTEVPLTAASERDLPLNANELNLLGETPPGYREADEQEVLL
jgi:hypothetical protein